MIAEILSGFSFCSGERPQHKKGCDESGLQADSDSEASDVSPPSPRPIVLSCGHFGARARDASPGGASASSSSSGGSTPRCGTAGPLGCGGLGRCSAPKFHLVPKNGWHPFIRRMGISACNTLKWMGDGPIPLAPKDCWLLPTNDDMALCIARLQYQLLAAGWKVLTCEPEAVATLSNKAKLREHAERLGLLGELPAHYRCPEVASYPCILKAAQGEHGKNVFIVDSVEEARQIIAEADLRPEDWLLQELIPGCTEYSVSLLVERGVIRDAVCTEYVYDCDVYVWPHGVEEVSRRSYNGIPQEHLKTMRAFLQAYSGICNFNYKVRKQTGSLCIFEINTRVGADLACDVPRARARQLFEKLDGLAIRLN